MAPQASSPADVLVVGAAGVGKRTLLSALRATAQLDTYSLLLDTKYYAAQLVVRCSSSSSSLSSSHSKAPGATTCGDDAEGGDQPGALILVVDASSRSSFDSAVDAYKQCLSAHACEEFEIQLLVANKMDAVLNSDSGSAQQQQEQQQPGWLQEARSWCYSNGFEYIQAAAGHASTDATLQDEDGEQQGVPCVRAALQAHMWPSMQPKQPGQQAGKHQQGAQPATPADAARAAPTSTSTTTTSSSTSTTSSNTNRDQDAVGAVVSPPESAPTQEQLPSTTSLDALPTQQQQQSKQSSADGPSVKPAQQQKKQQKQSAGAGDAATDGTAGPRQARRQPHSQQQQQSHGASAAAAVGGSTGDDDDDPFLDADANDDFEQLMRQVMGARVRLSGLPDAERRAAAADLALKLSAMMGLAGEDDDESDEGDDSEGERRLA